MNLDSTNLVLRFNPGQFTFRHFDHTANDEQLFNLARKVNSFQEDDAQIVKVQTFSVW